MAPSVYRGQVLVAVGLSAVDLPYLAEFFAWSALVITKLVRFDAWVSAAAIWSKTKRPLSSSAEELPRAFRCRLII